MPGLHAKKSPSGAKRLRKCPGNYAMVDSLPLDMRSGSGRASKLGTISHFLLETCLTEIVEPATYQGRLIQIVDEGTDDEHCVMLKPKAKMPRNAAERNNTFEIDDEVVENVTRAYDYVERRCTELKLDMSKLKLETRTNPVPDRDDTSGTADVTIDAWPRVLEVVDFKNGRIVVEHKSNPQVMAYLAGKAHDEGWDYESYWVTIVQPNGRHEEGAVRSIEVPKEDLLEFVDEHRTAAERADEAAEEWPGWKTKPTKDNEKVVELQDPDWAEQYLAAGDHCDFCDASGVCPAYRAFRQKQAREEDWDRDPETGEVEVPDLAAFRFTALKEALEVKAREGFFRTLIRKANGYLAAEAKAGRLPPGLKWVRKRSKREWKPGLAQEAIPDMMVKEGFISDNEKARLYAPSVLITGPQAEKLLNKGKGSSERKARFNDQFLHKPVGGLKLVLASDPGEPVPYSVGDDFEDDEEDDDE
jgi:hypothetical protein